MHSLHLSFSAYPNAVLQSTTHAELPVITEVTVELACSVSSSSTVPTSDWLHSAWTSLEPGRWRHILWLATVCYPDPTPNPSRWG